MGYKRIKLPYSYDALEPHLDKKTIELHYEKHHKSYEENLNNVILKTNIYESFPNIIDLLKNYQKIDNDEIKVAIREFGGGLANHNFYFESLKNEETFDENLEVVKAIEAYWDSMEEFKKEFEKQVKNLFGSGWVWFVKRKNNSLKIIKTFNQDNPWFLGFTPIIGIDLWEHSYYLKYQNKKIDYLNDFWKVVDWEFANKQFLLETNVEDSEDES